MIRLGEIKDIPEIVNLSEKFWAHTIYQEPFDHEHVANIVKYCIENSLLAVIDKAGIVGFIAAVKAPLLASPTAVIATEISWWVEPEYRKGGDGLKLLKFMEKNVKDQGIKYWNMVAMESSMPECVSKIYESMGYEKTETTYSRKL